MSILTTLKNTFLPSEEVSAARRKETFGTESKLVAGTAIVGTAAALIVAPAVAKQVASKVIGGTGSIGSVQVVKQPITTTIAKTVLSNKKTTAIATGATIFGTGVLSQTKKPLKAVASIPQEISTAGEAAGKSIETKSIDPLIQYGKDNPLVSGAALALGGGYLVYKGSKGINTAYNSYLLKSSMDNITDTAKSIGTTYIPDTSNKDKIPTDTATPKEDLPPPETTKTGITPQPITPETQIVGKPAASTSLVRKGKAKRYKQPIQSTRINIINQSKLFQTKKYIY